MDAGGKTLSMSSSGLRMIPVNEASSSPFALEEPEWIPDNQVCDTKRQLSKTHRSIVGIARDRDRTEL